MIRRACVLTAWGLGLKVTLKCIRLISELTACAEHVSQ